jgi:3'(2'), 5'-bisphosphate nucleotidase
VTKIRKAAMLQSLIDVSKNAGREILKIYNSRFAVEEKSDHSPLTAADRRSHDVITEHLKEHYPFPVLSEEGKDIPFEERKNWEYFWLVDPLDGTKEFIKRNGEFTVNISLIRQDTPVMGVIYVPVTGVLYHAVKGGGCYKIENGSTERLHVKCTSSHLTIVGSRSHVTGELEEYIRDMKKKYGDVVFLSAGSSLKLCLVAEGKADIYPRLGPTMEWDTAAGQIIVEEAGGRVVAHRSNGTLKYNKANLLNAHFIAWGGGSYV